MQESDKLQSKPHENEVDLGVFLTVMARVLRKSFSLFRLIFLSLYEFVLLSLLFVRRSLLWLVLGFLIGLGIGLQRFFSKGPAYYSDMVVRSNFESARLLYNQIDYFNSLIREHRPKDLSAIFHISENDALNLIKFEIEPVDDEMQAAKLYRNTFLEYKRNAINVVDTIWTRTMRFSDFKENLKPYDFPLQQIRLYSRSSDVYSKVQEGIVTSINTNKAFQQIKEYSKNIIQEEENLLSHSLQGLDSLRQAYNKRIASISTAKSEGNNVVFSDKDLRNPEIDLYDKELIFKDELINVKRKAIEQQDILQVHSAFNYTGTKTSTLDQGFIRSALIGLLISFVILLGIASYKRLEAIEKKMRTTK